MTEPANDPQTTPVDADGQPAVAPDTQSDPALDNGDSTDWSSEGGAATEGPATDTDNDDVSGS
ncbi:MULTISPECIES: hypothetical protein [Aeromicrobium]|uniref:hypothetical protein n=1 Tax=Aeromicrobium TaxID=2040 RepID=UPI0006F967F4|nr:MULTISPECIES: hypothetical protein [Aeromicrobium]KQX74756.1 hypothetical protein ASD10_05960 [Aeromicrobium sp. Root472D3]MCL8251965.1 hypothetical protein [Aeromicrobium fastidiosum]